MSAPVELLRAAPCAFVFDSGLPCGAKADHDVHRGRWTRAEPNHDFVPHDRRSGKDRRDPEQAR